MSFWHLSPSVDLEGDNDFSAPTVVTWQQFLNSMDLESEFESSHPGSGADKRPQIHQHHHHDPLLSTNASSTGARSTRASVKDKGLVAKDDATRAATPFRGSPVGAAVTMPDDGYSSEDEHDSPDILPESDSSSTPFYASPSITATTKAGSAGSAASTHYHSSSDAAAPCFFVNGVRHTIEAPQTAASDWTVVPTSLGGGASLAGPHDAAAAAMASKVQLEMPPWASPQADGVAPVSVSKTVVASNAAGTPAAWVCGSRQSPPQPPAYSAKSQNNNSVPSQSSASSSITAHAMQSSFVIHSSTGAYPASPSVSTTHGAAPQGYQVTTPQPPQPPQQYQQFQQQQQPQKAFFAGQNGYSAPATIADCPILGFVFVDGEGRLRIAPQGCTPSPVPAATHHPSNVLPKSPPSMPSLLPRVIGNPAAPSLPAAATMATPSKPAGGPCGGTQAWAFRDGRWMALSM